MYTQAYLLLKQRLAAIPNIKKVDWYLDKGLVISVPRIQVEFSPSETQQTGDIQKTTAKVRLHLVTSCTHTNDERIKRDVATDHMALFDAIFAALNSKGGRLSDLAGQEAKKGTEDDYRLFNSVSRNHITPPHTLEKQMKSIQQFTGIFYDHSATKNYTKTPATLVITV